MAAGSPSKAAPAAPGKAISDRVWPANASRRTSISHPAIPAATATMVPAASALTMKRYSRTSDTSWNGSHVGEAPAAASTMPVSAGSVPLGMAVVVVRRRVGRADHHQAPVGRAQDLDGQPVQPGELL